MSTEIARPAPSAIALEIENQRDVLLQLMPDRATQERFMAALLTYVEPRAELHSKLHRQSLMVAVYQIAKLGLDPGSDVYLRAGNDGIKLMVGYHGAHKLMLRVPGASHLHVDMIYANEHCVVEHGRVIEHVNSLDVKRRGPAIACVARLHFHDGRVIERIVDQTDIDIARKTGQNGWKISEGEMWRKTAILRLAKIVVLDEMTRSALEDADRSEYRNAPPQRVTPRVYAGPKRVELPEETAPEIVTETVDVETVEIAPTETEEI